MYDVTVLMATFNGEKYLKEQIVSVLKQEGVHVNLIVRDDGSTDSTLAILDQFEQDGKLTWYRGDSVGPALGFLKLLRDAPKADYYAFSDQDDVWRAGKLKRGIELLETVSATIPALYCSNYHLVDENLQALPSNNHFTTTTFSESLVASCCTGCTMIFNNALAEAVNAHEPVHIVMHDDWLHKVCLALGGRIFYDSRRTLEYRQHSDNVDGGIHSIQHRLFNVFSRIMNHNKNLDRSLQLQELLRLYGSRMPDENIKLLKDVAHYTSLRLAGRMKIINDPRLRTTSKNLNRGFQLAILFKYY